MINVLFVTLNNELRSTTCALDALFRHAAGTRIRPTIVFSENGSWSESLRRKNMDVLIRPLRAVEASAPLRALQETWFWIWLIRKKKIALIHVNEHENYTALRIAAKLTRTPVVVFCRFVVGGGYAAWLFSRCFVPDRILFTSQDQRQRSLVEFPSYVPRQHACVVGNGRDFEGFVNTGLTRSQARALWGLSEQDIAIGTSSSIRPRKRLEDFIEVIKRLVEAGFPVKGLIAGGGKYSECAYEQKLKTLITEYNLANHIRLLGNIDQVNTFYQALDVALSTSELETFGLSVSEAMAFGVPVFGYEGGSVQEVIGDDGCVVDNYDVDGLVAKVTEALSNPALLQAIGARAKKRVFEHFNSPSLAATLMTVYDDVLGLSAR